MDINVVFHPQENCKWCMRASEHATWDCQGVQVKLPTKCPCALATDAYWPLRSWAHHVIACRKRLGTRMLVCPYWTDWNQIETDVYGHYGRDVYHVPTDTLLELQNHLTEVWRSCGECRVYSNRRRRMVDIHYGCFACSGECYWDIVRALQSWEGPADEQQVVVITVRDGGK